MSQSTMDLELDGILSEGGQTPAQAPTPWSKQEDDQLLKELYALMGDIPKEPEKPAPPAKQPEPAKPEEKTPAPAAPSAQEAPEQPAEKPAPVEKPAPAAESMAKTQPVPKLPEQEPDVRSRAAVQEDWEELPNERSAPGWLKGTFLFLISLVLCGMTLYAVAADVLGPLF